MSLLDWWRRRRGEVRAHAPSATTGDDRFRPDMERFRRTPDDPRKATVLPPGGGAAGTFTSTVVTVNGHPIDPADPRAAPVLEMLRRIGAPGASPDAEALRQAVEALTGGPFAGEVPMAEAAPRADVATRLGELERLREAGLITEAEYAEKRRRILDAL